MRIPIVISVAAFLAACAQGPTRVEATNPTVTYKFTRDSELSEANGKAAQFCQGYGRSARLVQVTQRSGEQYAIYECV